MLLVYKKAVTNIWAIPFSLLDCFLRGSNGYFVWEHLGDSLW